MRYLDIQDKIDIALKALVVMEPKIKKSLQNVSYHDRKDLEQEIKLKLFEAIINNRIRSVPSFWEFKSMVDRKDEKLNYH